MTEFIKVEQFPVMLEDGGVMPTRAYSHDAGFDLYMPIDSIGTIPAGGTLEVDTGVHFQIPEGFYGHIESKSGLASNFGISVIGGIIDSGYRGSVHVILQSMGPKHHTFRAGDKVAQIVFHKIPEVELIQVSELEGSERGEKGFGSSGR